jgi:hypothetical protein
MSDTRLVAGGLRHCRKSASISQLDMAVKTASAVADDNQRSKGKMRTRRNSHPQAADTT